MAKYTVRYEVKHFETDEVLANFSTVVAARGWQLAYSKSEPLAIEYFESVLGNYHQGNHRQNIWSSREATEIRWWGDSERVSEVRAPRSGAARPANRRGSALNI